MMTFDKYEIINQVTSLLRENERLEEENEYLSSAVSFDSSSDSLQNHIYETGRDVIVKQALNDWHKVNITRDDEGHKVVEPYEDWIDHALDSHYIPSWISLDKFMKVFDDILKDNYKVRRQEALKKLAESEDQDYLSLMQEE